jgi:hypothetical protein
MVKNTRKKNIKYKLNKKKTKKNQIGGFSYDTWKNTINDEDNLDELNRFLKEINDNIDKVDIDKKDELINLINAKIDKQSNNSQPSDTSVSNESTPPANISSDTSVSNESTPPANISSDTSVSNESTPPSAPSIDTINQNENDIDDNLKNIPENIKSNSEIAKLIKQIKSKTATAEQMEEINILTSQYQKDIQVNQDLKTDTQPDESTAESSLVTANAIPIAIVDAMPIATSIDTDYKNKSCFDYISENEFVIKAPLSIKDKILKLIEDNNCSVTTSIFDSNGNVSSKN